MNELSGILSQRLLSQTKASLKSTPLSAPVEASQELQEINNLQMEKIEHAIALTKEIRSTLE